MFNETETSHISQTPYYLFSIYVTNNSSLFCIAQKSNISKQIFPIVPSFFQISHCSHLFHSEVSVHRVVFFIIFGT